MKLSIVIPVFNEINFIEEVLYRIQSVKLPDLEIEVVIVDDCSNDGTEKLLRSWSSDLEKGNFSHKFADNYKIELKTLKILFQNPNMGKGAALRKGFREASGDILLVQDADLEYDPKDYQKLIEPIISGEADVVYGSRFLGGKPDNIYFPNYLANMFLTKLSNFFTGLKLTDMETCYKAFRKEVLQKIELRENRFGIEPEITAKISKLKIKITEVPVSYRGRKNCDGKKIRIIDGVRAIWCIIKYNLLA